MPSNIENENHLKDSIENSESRESRLARIAAVRLLWGDDRSTNSSLTREEYEDHPGIAYSYECGITKDSLRYKFGSWSPSEKSKYYGFEAGSWDSKPKYILTLEAGLPNSDQQLKREANMYPLVKAIFRSQATNYDGQQAFTERRRVNIEESAPEMLQVLGLHDGTEIINPFQLQEWMKQAHILSADDNFLPVKILMHPANRLRPAKELEYPDRNDNLDDIIDQLFIKSDEPTADLVINQGILNYPDAGSPRGLIEAWDDDGEKYGIDDERMSNLIEIRDSWKDAQIVRTKSLMGDGAEYVALILPEQEVNVYGVAKEWAIAESPLEGNALFIVNPHLLKDGTDWRDVLLDTTKRAAVRRGAIKKVHTIDGKWRERILDIITAPTETVEEAA